MTRALLVAALLAAGCGGPIGMLHGGRLEGEPVSSPVEDWGFTREVDKIQLETAPDDPYSVNVWCVAKGPGLWVAAGSASNAWAKNLLADPRARVRVGERLYDRRAVRVTDPEEIALVGSLYEEKYEYERDPEDELGSRLFRLDPR